MRKYWHSLDNTTAAAHVSTAGNNKHTRALLDVNKRQPITAPLSLARWPRTRPIRGHGTENKMAAPSSDFRNNTPTGNHNANQRDYAKDKGIDGSERSVVDAGDSGERGHPDFVAIRAWCEGEIDVQHDTWLPGQLAQHRIDTWPSVTGGALGSRLESIYSQVKATGLPNCIRVKAQLDSELNVTAWEQLLTQEYPDAELLEFVKYGFPMGYMGPPSQTQDINNHASAVQFPSQVELYIEKEIECGAMVGPMDDMPFKEWAHISPLMSRPKTEDKRRIILDLSYPHERSINAFIRKNCVMGVEREHSLPTVDNLLRDLSSMGTGALMFTVDVARAYKNFRTCPLDWPLLVFQWNHKYFLEISMLFGARISSTHMQRIARAIVATLQARGVYGHMYLDDLVGLASDGTEAEVAYKTARELFRDLGLPEAAEKLQPPATNVVWLGVPFDTYDHIHARKQSHAGPGGGTPGTGGNPHHKTSTPKPLGQDTTYLKVRGPGTHVPG